MEPNRAANRVAQRTWWNKISNKASNVRSLASRAVCSTYRTCRNYIRSNRRETRNNRNRNRNSALLRAARGNAITRVNPFTSARNAELTAAAAAAAADALNNPYAAKASRSRPFRAPPRAGVEANNNPFRASRSGAGPINPFIAEANGGAGPNYNPFRAPRAEAEANNNPFRAQAGKPFYENPFLLPESDRIVDDPVQNAMEEGAIAAVLAQPLHRRRAIVEAIEAEADKAAKTAINASRAAA
jgi:hypothetical protein